MIRSKTQKIAALGAHALLFNAGCGGDSASISGTVTYAGKPVTRGVISVAPANGKGKGEGAKIVNGKYAIQQIAPGQKRVTVVGLTGADEAAPAAAISSEDFAKGLGKNQSRSKETVEIPMDAEGNGQTVEIELGVQTVNFDLNPPTKER